MYESEQYFVSMPKKHIFLQKGSSTLDDISLQNVIAHPAEFFFVFLMFNNSILSLQKASKRQTRWSYKNDLAPQNSYKMNTWKSTTLPFGPCYKKAWLGVFL